MCYYFSFNGFVVTILPVQEVTVQDISIYISVCVIHTYTVNWQISVFTEALSVQHVSSRYLACGVIISCQKGIMARVLFFSKLKM